ncbi:MAG: hypothetical protein ACT4P1_02330 [Sporichthyaceae bacterium]
MTEIQSPSQSLVAALPPRTRLLHIGTPKSGTTYLQRAAAANRDALLAHGTRYPGTAINHRIPVLALMGQEMGWGGAEKLPSPSKWKRLMAEVEADKTRRIYLSNESATLCDDAQAARFIDALGPRTHVLITLRGYAALLGSNWQQHVKTGAKISFDAWLRAVLAEQLSTDVGKAYDKRINLTAVVNRWVKVAGADRVTVVIADKRRPSFLTDVLADLLAVPRSVLAAGSSDGFSANRSMSYPEVEMVRALNEVVRSHGRTDWAQYSMLVRTGATARMLAMRAPAEGEPAVVLPEWAAAIAEPRSRVHADAVAASGARIIGSVTSLHEPVSTVAALPVVDSVPISAAAQALAGAISAATGRRAFFGSDPEKADPAVGRMRPGGGGGKIWDGPAVTDRGKRAASTDPLTASGRLAKVAGQTRAGQLREVYRVTETVPVRMLLATAGLRAWRRVNNTDRARSRGAKKS